MQQLFPRTLALGAFHNLHCLPGSQCSRKLNMSSLSLWLVQAYLVSLPCALLPFADKVCVYRLKVCGNPVSSKSIGTVFPIASAHFMALSHFGNSCSISYVFIAIIFVMVICDQ